MNISCVGDVTRAHGSYVFYFHMSLPVFHYLPDKHAHIGPIQRNRKHRVMTMYLENTADHATSRCVMQNSATVSKNISKAQYGHNMPQSTDSQI